MLLLNYLENAMKLAVWKSAKYNKKSSKCEAKNENYRPISLT